MTAKTEHEVTIGRFGQLCGFAADAGHTNAFLEFAVRLRALPESSRKLLAHIAELAYREHHDGRKPGAAYLPELHETCGIGVDEMYDLLKELEQAGFVRMEGEYPFQEVAVNSVRVSEKDWVIARDLWQLSNKEPRVLRDVIVHLQFDCLA